MKLMKNNRSGLWDRLGNRLWDWLRGRPYGRLWGRLWGGLSGGLWVKLRDVTLEDV